MTLDPTREEWLAARERIEKALPSGWPSRVAMLTEAALGPCPPEPAPSFMVHPYNAWGDERPLGVGIGSPDAGGEYVVLRGLPGLLGRVRLFMDADTAEEMAHALTVCAEWLREHGGQW